VDFYKNLPSGVFIGSVSALELYYGKELSEPVNLVLRGSLADIAREFDDVDFPGMDGCDAVARFDGHACLIRCIDDDEPFPRMPFSVQNLFYDPRRRVFLDPLNIYVDIRRGEPRLLDEVCCDEQTVLEAALLYSRFKYPRNSFYKGLEYNWEHISVYEQRLLLSRILRGKYAHRGLDILKRSGLIHALWPELARMDAAEHAKEHHPEGNAWEHTLETFRYRKTTDLALSLGLLLHDAGKPVAKRNEGNTFDRHAQIGSGIARRFLERLEFEDDLLDEVVFLVREHMLPAFIPRLPTYRTERSMSSPWFPKLLELFRCDLSSTFRGPEKYYEACCTYRSFLKNRKNPFRTAEGKKQLRLYVE
jgi:poly(A) polymerase